MERDVFNKYPDYLQDFEDIAALENGQWRAINAYNVQIRNMFEVIKLESVGRSGDYWGEFVEFPPGVNMEEGLKKLHQRYEVTTLEVLKSYMSCFSKDSNLTLEFDRETMTFTLTVDKSLYYEEYYGKIRDILPCNMMLVIKMAE